MHWLALFTWILVAAIAVAAARTQLASLAGQALVALAGLGATIVLVASGSVAFGSVAIGLACVGFVLGAIAASTLIEDRPSTAARVGQGRMETAAGLEGVELPLFVAAGLLSLWVVLS